MEFDFTQEVEFKVKTTKGETLLREPSAPEYMAYLNKLGKESEDGEKSYKLCIDYLTALGGDKEILEELPLYKLGKVISAVNGDGVEKK